jgi:6-phosphogluconolactonase
MELNIFQTPQALARAAAYHFVERCRSAVEKTDGFAVALSGGSTPRLLYELLADPHEPYRDRIAWKKGFFFFTDERHVPPDHPDSNYRMAYEALFSRVPKTQIIRMSGEKPAEEAAEEYEDILWDVFPEGPDFDLVLLGLGEDGHTASLFPGSSALEETERLVVAPWVEKLNAYRITLTLPVLNAGHSVVFLVTGASKAEILREVISKNENTNQSPAQDHAAEKRYPAQAICPTSGEVSWFVDEAAARLCSISNSSNTEAGSDLMNKNP